MNTSSKTDIEGPAHLSVGVQSEGRDVRIAVALKRGEHITMLYAAKHPAGNDTSGTQPLPDGLFAVASSVTSEAVPPAVTAFQVECAEATKALSAPIAEEAPAICTDNTEISQREPAGPVQGEAVKDHILREVVNSLRDVALKFHATGQLRARLRDALDPLLAAASPPPQVVAPAQRHPGMDARAFAWVIHRNDGSIEHTTDARKADEARHVGFIVENQFSPPGSTPAASWRLADEPDPHDGHYDRERAQLCMGNLTDDELANGAFMNYDQPLNIHGIIAGTHSSPIAWMTAVKDRIRWLSRALVKATAASTPEGDVIAKSKRILALVDDYEQSPTGATRSALRHALMRELESSAATPDFLKNLRAIAMAVAEEGYKVGSGSGASVATDQCRTIVNCAMTSAMIADLVAAMRPAGGSN